MNKKVCSFPILFALLALLIGTCAVVFPASAQAAPTSTGSITVSGTVASSYDAYQIFSANVVDGDSDAKIATDLTWASDAVRNAALPVLHSAGMPNSQTTAQEAAEWLNTDSHLTSALSAQLARSLQSSGAVFVALNAGTAAELHCGYWLIVADDDAIAQGEVGTPPIMALVGGSAVTVAAAKVALAVHQRVAQRKVLRHAHQRVIRRRVAVRVEFAQHIAHHARAFDGRCRRVAARSAIAQPHLVHNVEDAALHRLLAIGHVGQGAALDHRQGVFQVGALGVMGKRQAAIIIAGRGRRGWGKQIVVGGRGIGWHAASLNGDEGVRGKSV